MAENKKTTLAFFISQNEDENIWKAKIKLDRIIQAVAETDQEERDLTKYALLGIGYFWKYKESIDDVKKLPGEILNDLILMIHDS